MCILVKIEFLGHAGICVSTEQTKIVMDGWFTKNGAFDASWYQFPANHHYMEHDWSDLTAVIVSHEHMDHLDPEFLSCIPKEIPIYIPEYPSPNLFEKIKFLTKKEPKQLSLEKQHSIGDINCQIWTEESPMNQDSIWVFKSNEKSIVNTVDSRVSISQIQSMIDYIGGNPNLLLAQCSGASWFPVVYTQYEPENKIKASEKKKESKLNYVWSITKTLRPEHLAIDAGPPAFLDKEIFYANDDPIFPNPYISKKWLLEKGYKNPVYAPMPGDLLDLEKNNYYENSNIRENFSWENTSDYLKEYAQKMQPHINSVKNRIDKIQNTSFHEKLQEYFEKMFNLNAYFNERISMSVFFDINGPDGGKWIVNFSKKPFFKKYEQDDHYDYKYSFHSKWLKRILYEKLPWEDFFLSLRFVSWRNPDIYNDHLLGLLKFNDESATHAVEIFEKSVSDETLTVTTTNGQKYEIAKFCPHAGASLETGIISEKQIECSLHHYVFDLETGKCTNANCNLKTKKLDSN